MKKLIVLIFLVSWKASWMIMTGCKYAREINPYNGEERPGFEYTSLCYEAQSKEMTHRFTTMEEIKDFQEKCVATNFGMGVSCSEWKIQRIEDVK